MGKVIKERGRIGRTFVRTHCDCSILDENNNVVKQEYVLEGYYNDNIRAQNELSRIYPNVALRVDNLTHVQFYASMATEKFLKQADIITTEDSEKEN